MNKLTNLYNELRFLLDGKKAYLTGIASICTGIVNNDTSLILTGLSVIFLRNGIAKG